MTDYLLPLKFSSGIPDSIIPILFSDFSIWFIGHFFSLTLNTGILQIGAVTLPLILSIIWNLSLDFSSLPYLVFSYQLYADDTQF